MLEAVAISIGEVVVPPEEEVPPCCPCADHDTTMMDDPDDDDAHSLLRQEQTSDHDVLLVNIEKPPLLASPLLLPLAVCEPMLKSNVFASALVHHSPVVDIQESDQEAKACLEDDQDGNDSSDYLHHDLLPFPPVHPFRVLLMTSQDTVTVELIAEMMEGNVERGEAEESKTIDLWIENETISTLKSNAERQTFPHVRLLIATCANDKDGREEVLGMEVVLMDVQDNMNDVTFRESLSCKKSNDSDTTRSLSIADDDASVMESLSSSTCDMETTTSDGHLQKQSLATSNQQSENIDGHNENSDDTQADASLDTFENKVVESHPVHGDVLCEEDENDLPLEETLSPESEMETNVRSPDPKIAEDKTQPSRVDSTEDEDVSDEQGPDVIDAEAVDSEIVESIAKEDEENLDEAIVLSFVNDFDLKRIRETLATKRIDLSSAEVVAERPESTTRRVQSLLNGLYEVKSDDEDRGPASKKRGKPPSSTPPLKVKNVVQKIEQNIVSRRHTVTGNRHYKVSRFRAAAMKDDGDVSITSASTSSEKRPEHPQLACRLILRLASSDTESNASSSQDSSTTVSGSFILSVSATDVTRDAETKRLEDMHSFVMMFRQLKVMESRQQRLERQFLRLKEVPAVSGVMDDSDKEIQEQAKYSRIAERMKEINGRQIIVPDNEEQERLKAEYKRLEKELEQFSAAFMLSELHRQTQEKLEAEWENDHMEANLQALKQIRRYMPVNVRTMSVKTLINTKTPNGKFLPEPVARKFKMTTVLQLLRIDPKDIERMHPSVLEDLRLIDLTLIERRALHCHLKILGPLWEKRKSGVFSERRWAWYEMMKSNFKEALALHSGCGNNGGECEESVQVVDRIACLLDPEANIDYSDDYGYSDADEYELLTPSMRRDELKDFSATLNELRTTEEESDADFFGPIILRMKNLDLESLQFHEDVESLERTIRSLGVGHVVLHDLQDAKEISSSESSSSESVQS